MPMMDGYGFRKVQEMDSHLSSIPIVLMSAEGQLDIDTLLSVVAKAIKGS